MVSLDILEGLFGGPISCVPLVERPPLLAQPEKANAARRVRLSAASVDFSVVFMVLIFAGLCHNILENDPYLFTSKRLHSIK